MAADPALDPRVLASLRELTVAGEPDVLVEVLQLFLDEVPKKLQTMQSAVQAGDAALVARAAHSLRGSAGNIGAVSLLDASRRIENLATANDLEKVQPLVGQLTDEYHRVELEIKQLLRTS